MNNSLVCEVFIAEIKKMTFKLGAQEALEPDAYPRVFYQNFWDIVKGSSIKAVQSYVLNELNLTNLVLIPKA